MDKQKREGYFYLVVSFFLLFLLGHSVVQGILREPLFIVATLIGFGILLYESITRIKGGHNDKK